MGKPITSTIISQSDNSQLVYYVSSTGLFWIYKSGVRTQYFPAQNRFKLNGEFIVRCACMTCLPDPKTGQCPECNVQTIHYT